MLQVKGFDVLNSQYLEDNILQMSRTRGKTTTRTIVGSLEDFCDTLTGNATTAKSTSDGRVAPDEDGKMAVEYF